jgi:hypothetical protein
MRGARNNIYSTEEKRMERMDDEEEAAAKRNKYEKSFQSVNHKNLSSGCIVSSPSRKKNSFTPPTPFGSCCRHSAQKTLFFPSSTEFLSIQASTAYVHVYFQFQIYQST